MKKIHYLIFAIVFFTIAKAGVSQNQPTENNKELAKNTLVPIKYIKGWGTELNINPFNGSLSFNHSAGQIKIRKFGNSNLAYRASITIEQKNEHQIQGTAYTTDPFKKEETKTSTALELNLGLEKHFNNESRLTPYIGFDLGFGIKNAKHDIKYNDKNYVLNGAWQVDAINFEERGYLKGCATLFSGFDFYLANNFYVGYEFGFGGEYIQYKKVESHFDLDYQGEIFQIDSEKTSWRIGPQLFNGIRLGYNF